MALPKVTDPSAELIAAAAAVFGLGLELGVRGLKGWFVSSGFGCLPDHLIQLRSSRPSPKARWASGSRGKWSRVVLKIRRPSIFSRQFFYLFYLHELFCFCRHDAVLMENVSISCTKVKSQQRSARA